MFSYFISYSIPKPESQIKKSKAVAKSVEEVAAERKARKAVCIN